MSSGPSSQTKPQTALLNKTFGIVSLFDFSVFLSPVNPNFSFYLLFSRSVYFNPKLNQNLSQKLSHASLL